MTYVGLRNKTVVTPVVEAGGYKLFVLQLHNKKSASFLSFHHTKRASLHGYII